eukprot:3454396-Prymnesium_polylepis.2
MYRLSSGGRATSVRVLKIRYSRFLAIVHEKTYKLPHFHRPAVPPTHVTLKQKDAVNGMSRSYEVHSRLTVRSRGVSRFDSRDHTPPPDDRASGAKVVVAVCLGLKRIAARGVWAHSSRQRQRAAGLAAARTRAVWAKEADPQPGLVVFVCVFTLVSLALMLYVFQITVFHLERGLVAAEHHGSWAPVAPTESDMPRVASIEQLRLQRRMEREQWERTSGVVAVGDD